MVVHNTLKVGQEKLCPIIKRQMVSFKQNKTKWVLKVEKLRDALDRGEVTQVLE